MWFVTRFGINGVEEIDEFISENEQDSTRATFTIPEGTTGDYWVSATYVAEDGTFVQTPSLLVASINPAGAEPESLIIVPEKVGLDIGKSISPQLFVLYSDCTVMERSSVNASFESSNPEVLSVTDPLGWEALSEGSNTVTVDLNGMTATAFWVVQNSAQTDVIVWDSWREAFFEEAALVNLEISGPDADPDKDGATNLIEYVRASDPYRSDDLNTVVVDTVQEGDLHYAQVSFPLRDVLENISVTIQRSNGLNHCEDLFVATEPGALESEMIIDSDYLPSVSVFTLRDSEPLLNG